MKLTKILVLILLFIFTTSGFSKNETININFKNLEIKDLIKITSKILKKNILITTDVKGKVDFVSNKPIKKSDIINVLIYVLQAKGFTIVDNNDILRVVRINDTSKYNVPIQNKDSKTQYFQMITKVFRVDYSNVDYIASKIRHLISKSAKLVTDKESNSIVITDFPSNIKTIENIVKLITEDTKKYIQIIELENIDVTAASTNLKEVSKTLYNQKVEKEKVSIIASKNNNSIMLIGKKKNVLFLKNYIARMDKNESLVKRVVEVISLKNVESTNVIKIIDSIIGKKKYLDESLKPLSSVDEETNSIILSGPFDEIEYIKLLITKLDKDKLQVYVKTSIIEISEVKINDVGIKYGLTGLKEGTDGLLSISGAFAENYSMPSVSLTSSTGAVSSFDALALGVGVNFLQQNGAADIVSEPSILCVNNQESSIYVGKTISIKTNSSTTSSGQIENSFKREDIGLTLKVKPRISNDNKVTLDISTILEDVEGTNTNEQPNTSKKEVKTMAIVNDGESVIIGGLIRNKSELTEDKVPFFGDIPLIGALFRSKREIEDKINLIVIVTPYIISKSNDLSSIRTKLSELRLMENKYAKDLELRLLKNRIETSKKDKERKEELKNMLDELEDKQTNNQKSTSNSISEKHRRILFGENSEN